MTESRHHDALRRLEGDEFRPLWAAVRARLERSSLRITNRPLALEVDDESRRAIAGLLGLSPAGSAPLSVRLDRLDSLLQHGAAAMGLHELLEHLDGPLIDRRSVGAARRERATAVWDAAHRHPACERHPGLHEWLDAVRSSGVAMRAAGGADSLDRVLNECLGVLEHLPADSAMLATLASERFGDSHALDRHRRLGSLTWSALAFVGESGGANGGEDAGANDVANLGSSDGAAAGESESDDASSGGAMAWRQGWARVGVICDDLSVSVLALGLRVLDGDDPLASSLELHRRAATPVRLTLQQLESARLNLAPDAVWICENPTVMREAMSLGPEVGALVCTDGQPNTAFDRLASIVGRSGAPLRVHADFDWGGLRIASGIIARHGAHPWRFDLGGYLEALEVVDRVQELGPPPAGAASPWDPGLAEAMVQRSVRIYEEQVLASLLSDLDRR